jgi:hypothetical protein
MKMKSRSKISCFFIRIFHKINGYERKIVIIERKDHFFDVYFRTGRFINGDFYIWSIEIEGEPAVKDKIF